MEIRRGEIYSMDLLDRGTKGLEIGKVRPGLVIQANDWNKRLASTIIVPITSQLPGYASPRTVMLKKSEAGLDKDSNIVFSQIRSVDKSRLKKKIGDVSDEKMKAVDQALSLTLGLKQIE